MNILDLEEVVADQEARLTAAEENIQGTKYFSESITFVKLFHGSGMNTAYYNVVNNFTHFIVLGLQMTDVDLDARVTALEEYVCAIPQNGKLCRFNSLKSQYFFMKSLNKLLL